MEAQEGRLPSLFITLPIQIIVASLLFIALLVAQRNLAILTLIVLGLTIGTRLWSRMSLSGVTCHAAVDRGRVFPGETLHLQLEAVNAKFLPVWVQMQMNPHGSFQPVAGDENFTRESGLLWYERVCFPWALVAQRRGVHPIGLYSFRVGDLLGFYPREKEAEEAPPVIVYPRLVPLKPLSLPRRDFFGIPGAESPVQDPIYILGTREYQHWRPARFIHWKASARHSRLQEKVFEPTEQEKVLLVLAVDQFAKHGAESEFEQSLEVVASLAVRLDRQGYAVGLVTNGVPEGGGPTIVPVTRNPQHLPALLEVLARLQMASKEDLLDTLQRRFIFPWGVSCVYFSFEEDKTTVATEEYFRQQNTPVIFFVCRHRAVSEEEGRKVRSRLHSLDALLVKGPGAPS